MRFNEIIGQPSFECWGRITWLIPLITVLRLRQSECSEEDMES